MVTEHGYTKAERGRLDWTAPRSHLADSLTEQRLRVMGKRKKEKEVVGQGDGTKRKRDVDLEERVCNEWNEGRQPTEGGAAHIFVHRRRTNPTMRSGSKEEWWVGEEGGA